MPPPHYAIARLHAQNWCSHEKWWLHCLPHLLPTEPCLHYCLNPPHCRHNVILYREHNYTDIKKQALCLCFYGSFLNYLFILFFSIMTLHAFFNIILSIARKTSFWSFDKFNALIWWPRRVFDKWVVFQNESAVLFEATLDGVSAAVLESSR